MNKHTLGRTGLSVSEVGIGFAFTSRQGSDLVERGVRSALASGVNYFDCAPYYSAGTDEENLGHALKGLRDDVVLSTKVGYTEHPDDHRSAAGLMRQLDGSLARLQTDWVDLIQIHEADFRKWWVNEPISAEEGMSGTARLIADDETYDFAAAPVVEFLRNARAAGKARHVGVTGKDARQLARVAQAIDVDTAMVAHQFNPVMRNAAEFLFPVTSKRGMGVVVAAPFMRGILAASREKWRSEPPAWMDEKFKHAYLGCVALAEQAGITLSELTIRWILAEPRKHAILFGFRAPEEIRANVEAVGKGPLPPDLEAEVDKLGLLHPLLFQGRTCI